LGSLGERRAGVLLLFRQLLAQPRHRPIEVMQIEFLDAGVPVNGAPACEFAADLRLPMPPVG